MRLVGSLEASERLVSSAATNTAEWACARMLIMGDIPGSPLSQLKSRAAKDGRSVHELIPQSVEADLRVPAAQGKQCAGVGLCCEEAARECDAG